MRECRKGFTLVELLIVIAVLAILTALSFPVFAAAREKARQTTCASNLKQLAMASRMYSADYDGGITPGAMQTDTVWHLFTNLLHPYVNNSQIFICPSATSESWTGSSDYGPPYLCVQQHTIRSNYTINYCVAQGFGVTARETDLTKPAETIEYCDGVCPNAQPSDPATTCFGVAPTRHNGGCNVSFYDGHVKWLKSDDVRPGAAYWSP